MATAEHREEWRPQRRHDARRGRRRARHPARVTIADRLGRAHDRHLDRRARRRGPGDAPHPAIVRAFVRATSMPSRDVDGAELDGREWLRAAGTWDELTLEGAYRTAGRQAETACWRNGREDSSVLVRIALNAVGAS